jgi:hypothetical protein
MYNENSTLAGAVDVGERRLDTLRDMVSRLEGQSRVLNHILVRTYGATPEKADTQPGVPNTHLDQLSALDRAISMIEMQVGRLDEFA